MVLEIDTFDTAPVSTGPRRRRRNSRLGFAARMIFGAAALGGVWLFAATTTVSSLSPSYSAPEKPEFTVALSLKPVVSHETVEAEAKTDPLLKINKFSRLYQQPAAPKATRLEGAQLAALKAKRPDGEVVAAALGSVLASEEIFASLDERRLKTHADAIKTALGEALNQTIALAPRIEPDEPSAFVTASIPQDLGTDEVLSDEGAVELATIEAEEAGRTAEVAAMLDDTLPDEGPLPISRPNTAIAKLAKPDTATATDDDDAAAPTVLAFAKPDNPVKPSAKSIPWPDVGTKKVAIYDISNGVVHMPDGTRLEAHSGIGKMRDNPKYTHVKMKGPTPPGTYKLSMREKLFHGVAAIRLTSVDGKHPQGRTGLLAHTYLLRSRPGDSHGCVAFKDYDKFLSAFRRGKITHMVIVPEYNGRLPRKNNNLLVKLFGGRDA